MRHGPDWRHPSVDPERRTRLQAAWPICARPGRRTSPASSSSSTAATAWSRIRANDERGRGYWIPVKTLRNQPYAPQQLVESRIAPQRVQSRVGLEISQPAGSLLVSFVEPFERVVRPAEAGAHQRQIVGRDIGCLRTRMQFTEYRAGLRGFPRACVQMPQAGRGKGNVSGHVDRLLKFHGRFADPALLLVRQRKKIRRPE